MYEIVVLSGKGGTGKTSITASLAVLASENSVIADCDVDAANMHLLLAPDFGQSDEFYSGELASINQSQCSQCGICAEICRFDAIPFANNQYSIHPLNCEGCAYCAKVCPNNAIVMHPRKSGNLYKSQTRVGSKMVHARMDIGADNSGKLVAQVKNEAKAIAKETSKEWIIVDGSPGTGCPVVSALSGANFVLLVTEPSMSGMHDLRRVYQVIKKMNIKAGCIINKSDLNPQKTTEIIDFLTIEKIAHLGNFHYDPLFTSAMVQAKTIVEVSADSHQKMQKIWINIQALCIQ
jgi:MinD superfamily P-loop ATPase